MHSPLSLPMGKEQCPECAAKGRDRHGDNMTVYSDGHKFCFSCRHYVKGRFQFVPKEHMKVVEEDKTPRLPHDATELIPAHAGAWLAEFNITYEELKRNKIVWSESRHLLIFPFYGSEGNLEGYQGRYFGKDRPKYHTSGQTDSIFWYQGLENIEKYGIIVVEDCISAIKVGRVATAIPLLGSSVPHVKMKNFKLHSNRLTFWLDYDKGKESFQIAYRAGLLGYESKAILTECDPKVYDTDMIEEILCDNR